MHKLHFSITSLLHVSVFYVHHLQGEPLIVDFKLSPCSVCFLLGNYPASGVYTLTFRNTLSVPSS